MLKNWFQLAAASFAIGFTFTFLISNNFQQSVLAGLIMLSVIMIIVISAALTKIINFQSNLENLQLEIATSQDIHKKIQEEISQLQTQRNKISSTISGLQKSITKKNSLLCKINLELDSCKQNKQIDESQTEVSEEFDISEIPIKEQQIITVGSTEQLVENTMKSSPIELAIEIEQPFVNRMDVDTPEIKASFDKFKTTFYPERRIRKESKYLYERDNKQQQTVDVLSLAIAPKVAAKWHVYFENNPHLDVLEHIEKYGVATESEVSNILGNYRAVRQFTNNLREYSQYLPFSIKVEASASGNRYIKYSDN